MKPGESERDSKSVIGIEILREEVPGGEKSFRKWRESIFREHAHVHGSFGRDSLAAWHSFLYLHNKPLHLGHSSLLSLFHTPTSLCFSVALYLPTPSLRASSYKSDGFIHTCTRSFSLTLSNTLLPRKSCSLGQASDYWRIEAPEARSLTDLAV